MAKVKLTKGELKRQRDSLKQYCHFLPTLILKKQQLQMKIIEARQMISEREVVLKQRILDIESWAGLLGESGIDMKPWIIPTKVLVKTINIAGANVPFFDNIVFGKVEYDLYTMPFWVDQAIEELRILITLLAEVAVITQRIKILNRELRITTQRVNLFEKVKIPECRENIRKIGIYLGDQQANAVGISKVVKKKIEVRDLELVAA